MKKVEIIGFKRANLGKSDSKALRAEGNVPCVLYGGKEQVHFQAPMIMFRELVYTPEAAFVSINVEGKEYSAILQDIQFHPVSEMILHADFLELFDDKEIKMEIPVTFTGRSVGVGKGGKLVPLLRKLKVKAFPKNMPETITIDISDLDLGKSVKVREVETKDFEITNPMSVSIATVNIPRSLRSKQSEEEDGEEETAAAE